MPAALLTHLHFFSIDFRRPLHDNWRRSCDIRVRIWETTWNTNISTVLKQQQQQRTEHNCKEFRRRRLLVCKEEEKDNKNQIRLLRCRINSEIAKMKTGHDNHGMSNSSVSLTIPPEARGNYRGSNEIIRKCHSSNQLVYFSISADDWPPTASPTVNLDGKLLVGKNQIKLKRLSCAQLLFPTFRWWVICCFRFYSIGVMWFNFLCFSCEWRLSRT